MAGRYRPRKEYKFWLFHDLPEHQRLMEFIQYCKSTRQFAKVVRDGIRLIWSLREGNMTILFELFPHLERQFKPDSELLIAEFREMLLSQKTTHAPVVIAADPPTKPASKLGAVKLDLPVIADDDDVMETRVSAAANTGNNLYAGMLGMGL